MYCKIENYLFGNKNRYQLTNEEKYEISKDFKNANILVLGAAGSIGSLFVENLFNYTYKNLYLIDKNENAITELARILNLKVNKDQNIEYICSDIGVLNLENFIKKNKITHYLNFAALKHVRSEENFLASKYMFLTNCIYPFEIKNYKKLITLKKIFSISTDKAVSPSSVMGITKKIMEYKLAQIKKSNPSIFVSSVRFANVSFSNGSLLKSVYEKTNSQTPFGVPKDIKRFFIKRSEAVNLCLKSLLIKSDASIIVPSKDSIGLAYDLLELTKKIIKFFKKKLVIHTRNKTYLKFEQPIVISKMKLIGQKNIEVFYEKSEKIMTYDNDKEITKVSLKVFKNIDKALLQIKNSSNKVNFIQTLKKFSKNKKISLKNKTKVFKII